MRECLSGLVCQNGGICVPGSGVTPDHCDCLPGFLGDECACEYIANYFVLSSAFGKNVYNFVTRAHFMFTDTVNDKCVIIIASLLHVYQCTLHYSICINNLQRICWVLVTGCANADCHEHGSCIEMENGQAMCVCDHSRWTHSSGAAVPPGDCADETQNGVTCHNGASCV